MYLRHFPFPADSNAPESALPRGSARVAAARAGSAENDERACDRPAAPWVGAPRSCRRLASMHRQFTPSLCAEHFRRLGDRVRLDPEDRAEASFAAPYCVDRNDIDLRGGELSQQPGHRTDSVVGVVQESRLALGKLEAKFFRGLAQVCAVLRHQIEL